MSVRVPNWRELSDATGLAVLTFPSGWTLTSAGIVSTCVNEPRSDASPRRHVSITYMAGDVMANVAIYEDVDAVAEMAADAHRSQVKRVTP
jgi:hypothetical protein